MFNLFDLRNEILEKDISWYTKWILLPHRTRTDVYRQVLECGLSQFGQNLQYEYASCAYVAPLL